MLLLLPLLLLQMRMKMQTRTLNLNMQNEEISPLGRKLITAVGKMWKLQLLRNFKKMAAVN
jgi:hypothetical protein